jgi:hypothetical protein
VEQHVAGEYLEVLGMTEEAGLLDGDPVEQALQRVRLG